MSERYLFDRFEVRPTERLLLADGAPLPVGARAFDLLMCLLTQRGRVVPRDEVLRLVWPGLVVEENNLSVQISSLRKLLGARSIATVSRRGYRFTPTVEVVDAPAVGRPASAPPAKDGNPSTIAVLPFAVLSDDPQLSFLADGLAEDVIALLARVPGFQLISRASSFGFRGLGIQVTDIARQLGVRFVVEGSVRLLGDGLRVSTQLSDAANGHVLWSGRFNSRRDAAVDLQEDIARGIISELEPELTRAEIARIRRQRNGNQDVWAHYHQAIGSIAMRGWGGEAIAEARSQLRQSVTLDPSFGLGHAHYALLTALSRNIALLPDSTELVNDALDAAERAIALDDGSSEVLGYAGCALCDLGHHDRGAEILHRALDIDPSNAQAHVALGAAMGLKGQLAAGIEKMRHGMKLSPRDRRLGFWGWALGIFLLRADRLDEALTEARASIRRDPRFHHARVLEAAVLDRQGRIAEATAALTAARQANPSLTQAEIAWTHGRRVGERMGRIWAVD